MYFGGNRRWVPLFSHGTTSLSIWNIQELEGHAQFPFCWIDFENLAVVREVQQFYACATFKNQTFHSTLLVPIWYLLLYNKNLHGRITDPIFSRFKISVLCKRNIFKIFHRHTRKTAGFLQQLVFSALAFPYLVKDHLREVPFHNYHDL